MWLADKNPLKPLVRIKGDIKIGSVDMHLMSLKVASGLTPLNSDLSEKDYKEKTLSTPENDQVMKELQGR